MEPGGLRGIYCQRDIETPYLHRGQTFASQRLMDTRSIMVTVRARQSQFDFTSNAAVRSVLFDPELKFGEAYMNGGVVVEHGTIAGVLGVLLGQPAARKPKYWMWLVWLFRYLLVGLSSSTS